MKEVSFNKFKFNCNQCGDCCYKVLVKRKIPVPSYDYTGRFKFNPNTSVVVNYHEKPEIEKYIDNNTKFKVKIIPMEVFFMKNFKIGFIYEYQMAVKNKQYCYYYDKENKRCQIYSHRPAVCKYYPLLLTNRNFHIPKPNADCILIKNYIEIQYNVRLKEKIRFNLKYEHLKKSFPMEYKIFLKTRAEWFIQNLYVQNLFEDLLIPPAKLSLKIFKEYKIRDMKYFFEELNINFKNPENISLLEEFKENYDTIAKKALKERQY